jgi:TonB family protein
MAVNNDYNLAILFLAIPMSLASANFFASAEAFDSSYQIVRAKSIPISGEKSRVLIAQGDGGESNAGGITDKIRIVVENSVRKNWRAPSAADGSKAIVRFTIASSGQLSGSPMLSSSAGNAEFDQAGMDAINKISALPPLPSYLSNIQFVATFHAGKAPWAELKVDGQAGGGGSQSTASSQTAGSGQSGWTQPSGDSTGDAGDAATALSATGQSDWIDPSIAASQGQGQSGWTQPSGSTNSGQSGWTSPTGSPSSGQSGWNQPPGNSAAGQAQSGSSGFPSGQNPPASNQGLELQAQPGSLINSAPVVGKAPASSGKNPPPALLKPGAPAAHGKTPTVVNAKDHKPPVGNSKAPVSSKPSISQASGQQQQQQQPTAQPPQTDMTGSQDLTQRVVLLNNNAVVAIADNNYEVAIKKLEEALKIDPTYKQASANLAIAYNNYGLQLKDRPDDAIKVFHKAFALDPGNEKTKINLNTIIQYMGKSPTSFKDRLDLGNKAVAQGDRVGARIEYEAALAIKPDPIVQQKLYAIASGAPLNALNSVPPSNNQIIPSHLPNHLGAPGTQAHTGQSKPGQSKPAPGMSVKKPPENLYPDSTNDGAPTGVSQKLDTMYRNLKALEIKTFNKPFESDDVLTRLSRLEQKLLGKAQQGKPMRRLDALLILQ